MTGKGGTARDEVALATDSVAALKIRHLEQLGNNGKSEPKATAPSVAVAMEAFRRVRSAST